jgi:hypothetical protein
MKSYAPQVTFTLPSESMAKLKAIARERKLAWGALAKAIVLEALAKERPPKVSHDLDTTIQRFLLLYGQGANLERAAAGCGLSIETAERVALTWLQEREAA